jgi:hypothetical protein
MQKLRHALVIYASVDKLLFYQARGIFFCRNGKTGAAILIFENIVE